MKQEVNGYFKTLTAYQPRFTSWSGELYESELVRSSIDSRARHISKLKVEIEGSAQPVLQTRLRKAPNTFQTWSQFLYRLSTLLDMNNTAFIFPQFNQYMEVIGIYTGNVQEWSLLQDEMKTPWLKVVFPNGSQAVFKLSEVGIMTKFQYKEDFFGDTNTALNDTMSLINIQNQGIEEAVSNSSTYRFMAQLNNFSTADDLAAERQSFSANNFGSENGGGLLLFPNTYTNVQQIKATPYEVDTAQRELIQQNVFNYFGTNLDILQNKAIGDAWNAFYEGCVEVFSIQFSEVLTRMLFTETEQAFGALIMATANRLQYMSNTDKMNFVNNGLDRGMISINEAREVYNMAPVDGGDVRTIRGEYKNATDLQEGEEDGGLNGED